MKTKGDFYLAITAERDGEELEAANDWISRYQDELAEERAAREADREASESTRRERDNFMNALMRLWIGMGHGGSLDCDVLVGEALERLKAAQPTAKPATVDLVAWIEAQREFSLRAFGPGARTEGNLRHIAKELDEIRKDPRSLTERIDVVILALDGAWRAGFGSREIADALWAKLEVNKSRSWPDWRTKREDEPIEHVKAAQPAAEAPAALSRAESDILAERTSQRARWGVDHDDEHGKQELAMAAMAYITGNRKFWPFVDGWKPRTRREDLVRAGALLIAEIERVDRFDESFQAPEVRAMHAAVASAPFRTGGSKCSMEITPASAEAPVAAPVVGGVTEAMLDAIYAAWNGVHVAEFNRLIDAARDAIRAQKRVDVEALRKVASELSGSGDQQWEDAILRAIGDETAEALSPEPAPFSIKSTGGESVQWAELAAPEGPFTARGQNLWEGERVIAWCNAYANLGRLVSLLNAGLEVEKTRQGLAHAEQVARNWEATAAQFSKDSDFYQGLLRRIGNVFGTAARTADDGIEQDDVLALKVPELVEELHRRMVAIDNKCVAVVGIEHAGKLAEGSTDAVIARMKDAEQRAAELESKLAAAESTVRESYRAVDAATAERLEVERQARRGDAK